MLGQESSSGFSLEGVEDVEDYLWVPAKEGETPLPWDSFQHVFTLVQSGNNAFRKNHLKGFEEAIICYSRANVIKPSDSIILGNRCAAYIRLSQFLRTRTPPASELTPVNALDPTIHAELALKNADKLVDLKNHAARSYILKANCLCLLEKYEMARDTILSGLNIDPSSNSLYALLGNIERMQGTFVGRRKHGKSERTDDLDCAVCLKLLYEPITTPCGHSFCRSCLFQSMNHGNKCPLCRTVLFVSPRGSPVSVTLNNIIQKSFPEEYAKRKAEHKSLTNLGNEFIPLFVLIPVTPFQKYHLNIFEPWYRLMVRRIMEGNHRMGMVNHDPSTGSVADFACEAEITECEPLPDGRIYIEIEGKRRFRILRSWGQDGYRVAEVEWIQDALPPGVAREDLQEMARNVAERAAALFTRAKQEAQQDQPRYEGLLSLERRMPSPQDPESFSFWLVSLTNRSPSEKLDLLRLRDTRERIKRGLIYLEGARTTSLQSSVVI